MSAAPPTVVEQKSAPSTDPTNLEAGLVPGPPGGRSRHSSTFSSFARHISRPRQANQISASSRTKTEADAESSGPRPATGAPAGAHKDSRITTFMDSLRRPHDYSDPEEPTPEQHVVPVPYCQLVFRAAQLVIAIVILAFVSVAINVWCTGDALVLALFTSCATLLIIAYDTITSRFCTRAYNRWAILFCECVAIALWCATFGMLVDWAVDFDWIDDFPNNVVEAGRSEAYFQEAVSINIEPPDVCQYWYSPTHGSEYNCNFRTTAIDPSLAAAWSKRAVNIVAKMLSGATHGSAAPRMLQKRNDFSVAKYKTARHLVIGAAALSGLKM